MKENYLFVCPNCNGKLDLNSNSFLCRNCGGDFPVDGSIPDFLLIRQKENGETLKNRASHFDNLSKVYGSSLWGGSPKIIAWLITGKIKNKNGIGLDIACGTGQIARPMAKKMNYVYGVDISMGMVQNAEQLSKKNSIENISFARCDAENLPFNDNTFNFVSCSGALHAFPDTEKALKEMQRVLKKNGTLAIMTLLEKKVPSVIDPTKRELKKSSGKEDAIKFDKAHNSMANVDVKLHRFTLTELKLLISKLGLNNLKYIKFGPIIIFSVKK